MIIELGKLIKYYIYVLPMVFYSVWKEKNIIQVNQCININ